MINNYQINKIYQDEFGRVSGVFAVDKPVGQLSHDVVYEYRKKFNTKKVGHAGTLDPFASGLLIILVGKATKLSDKFLSLDKEYVAEIALEVETETLDPEGKIVKHDSRFMNQESLISKNKLEEVIESFKTEYEQYVPVFSSVKVQGNKLRELARKSDRYEIYDENKIKKVKFFKDEKIYKELELPRKTVRIYEIELLEIGIKEVRNHLPVFDSDNTHHRQAGKFEKNFGKQLNDLGIERLNCITLRVKCSKGTYIRKLAQDIGVNLGIPAMLINLRRTKIGDISV